MLLRPTSCRRSPNASGALLQACLILLAGCQVCVSGQLAAQHSQTEWSTGICNDAVPDLVLEHRFNSNHTKCRADITVVTQLGFEQKDKLLNLCLVWKGWVSAAMYVPAKLNNASLVSSVAAWHTGLEQVDACSLDLAIYTLSRDQQLTGVKYANALMNRALATAGTEMVLPLGIDAVVSNDWNLPAHNEQLLDIVSAGACIVIPAWTAVQTGRAALKIASGTKADVVKAYTSGLLTLQTSGTAASADVVETFNLQHWLQSNALYGMEYEQGYVPSIVVSRKHTAWFDERIYSAPLGRALHLEHMHARGLGFVVHPAAYIVEQQQFDDTDPAAPHEDELLDGLTASTIRKQMAQGTYQPTAHFAPCDRPYQWPSAVGSVASQVCSDRPSHGLRPHVSPLWGLSGEAFLEEDALRDWSRAGYGAGDRSIPQPEPLSNLVLDWNAVGDGVTDDTQALKQAVQQSPAGSAIYLPPGKYRITEMINITRPVILRGAGAAKTTLFFPFSLTDVYGNVPDSSSGYSQWAFRPAFINFLGEDPVGPQTLLTHVTQHASRGSKQLMLSKSAAISLLPGTWIRLVQSDPGIGVSTIDTDTGAALQRSLIEHLYGDWDLMTDAVPDHLQARELHGTQYAAQLIAQVVSFQQSVLTLDRALPFDVDPHWSPEIHVIQATMREAGIESLSIEFAAREYGGHFQEAGYNALYFSAAHDCWAKHVQISNADYGIGLNGTHFCTLQEIQLFDTIFRDNGHGHHGIDISYGSDNLVTQFKFYKEFLHDLSIEWYTHGNVFSGGFGSDLNLDHHRGAAFGNLFVELKLGKGTRPFASSGAHGRGPHSGAHNVYWNLVSDGCWTQPDTDFGHELVFAGKHSAHGCTEDAADADVPYSAIFPSNLHSAMLLQRRGAAQQLL